MKNILICGASKNLGYFFFKNLKDSHNIYLFSRNEINYINFIKTDLSKTKYSDNAFKKLKKKISKIDAIIFCIGDSKKNYKEFPKTKDFISSFSSNFFPLVNLINSYIKNFKNKPTQIIAISSVAGIKNINAPITYSVSKNALNYYLSIMSKELINFNIRLNIISPGNILMENNNWSKKLKKNKSKTMNYIYKNVPTRKFCKPSDFLNMCKLLIETDNNFLGSNIVIDGGQIL
ncbi:DltE Short-chain dehydrogenases of various substrate specificities [Candidatus Pelagibacterales bacterium]